MGLDVTIEHDGIGVLFTYSGVLEGDQVLVESQALYTPEIMAKLHYQLVDLRDVNRIELTTEQIQHYLSLMNPLDKAGAYAIQEHGELIIEEISGSFSNVVGLPLERLEVELESWRRSG